MDLQLLHAAHFLENARIATGGIAAERIQGNITAARSASAPPPIQRIRRLDPIECDLAIFPALSWRDAAYALLPSLGSTLFAPPM
jgi:hypothetical protein